MSLPLTEPYHLHAIGGKSRNLQAADGETHPPMCCEHYEHFLNNTIIHECFEHVNLVFTWDDDLFYKVQIMKLHIESSPNP